jgi:hypothetical protein
MKYLYLLVLLVMIGCERPRLTAEYANVPGGPKIVFFFQGGTNMPPPLVTMDVKLDGHSFAWMRISNRLEMQVAPGLHTITVGLISMTIDIKDGETKYLRASADNPNSYAIYLVTKEEASIRLAETVPLTY